MMLFDVSTKVFDHSYCTSPLNIDEIDDNRYYFTSSSRIDQLENTPIALVLVQDDNHIMILVCTNYMICFCIGAKLVVQIFHY